MLRETDKHDVVTVFPPFSTVLWPFENINKCNFCFFSDVFYLCNANGFIFGHAELVVCKYSNIG